jgi:hypothetical protein
MLSQESVRQSPPVASDRGSDPTAEIEPVSLARGPEFNSNSKKTQASIEGPNAIRKITLRLDVLRLEAPKGTFSGNQAFWNLLDEMVVEPNMLLTLRENGFRYGVASPAARDAVKALLDQDTGVTVAWDRARPRPDLPVELVLRTFDRDMTLFCFDRLGRMSGASFVEARPYLSVEMHIDPAEPASTMVRIVPEVREPPGPIEYVRTPTGFRPQPQYRGRVFDALVLERTLTDGQALIVGPTADVHRLPILGRPFFIGEEGRESLFVFSPWNEVSSFRWTEDEFNSDGP